MYNIHVDHAKNCLYVTFKGVMNAAEVKAATDKIIAVVKELPPGFIVVNDMSDFNFVSPRSVEEAKRAIEVIFQRQVKLVIRVGENPIALMQFKRAKEEAKATYAVLTAQSLDEAKAMVAKMI